MPVNKYALLRYRIIDRCINNTGRPFPSKENLRSACEEALYGSDGENISTSTIEKDIWAMRNESELGYYAPISYHRDERGYYYEEENYSINELQLNEDDIDAIRFAANTLIQFRDLPIFKQFDQAIGKIADRLSVAPDLDTTGVDKFMQFESTPSAGGSHHLAPLLAAARGKKPVTLTYKKFSSEEETEYEIHPYLLKEYRNRWYLLAWDTNTEMIKTFGCDRIQKITPDLNNSFSTINFDSENYFKHAIGITVIDDSPPVEVVLKCEVLLALYLSSQPLHTSQSIVKNSDHSIVTLNVLITYELVHWLIGVSAELEVLAPESLKNRLKEKLSKASIY